MAKARDGSKGLSNVDMAARPLLGRTRTGVSGEICNARATQAAVFYEPVTGAYAEAIAYMPGNSALFLGKRLNLWHLVKIAVACDAGAQGQTHECP